MSFQITHPAGGTIDKVRELPYPHFSKFTRPFVRGRMIDVTGVAKIYEDTYSLPYATEFLSVAFAASEYCIGDFWELTVNGDKICETVYTKELPESVSMGNSFGIVYPLPDNAEIKFEYHNLSGSVKQVWYNVKFLRK